MPKRLFISARTLQQVLESTIDNLPPNMRLVAVEPGVDMDGSNGFILVFKELPAPVRPGPSLGKERTTTE